EAGTRQTLSGDLQDARQGVELMGGETRAAFLKRRDPRYRGCDRRGSAWNGDGSRSVGVALRQDRIDDRRGCRRRAYRGAAAHAFLPSLSEADRTRPYLRREPAA